jgi:hypothetical protein
LASFGRSPDARESFIATDAGLAQLWRGPGCAVMVVNRSDLPHIRPLLGSELTIIGCQGKKLALYNRQIPGPAASGLCTQDFHP